MPPGVPLISMRGVMYIDVLRPVIKYIFLLQCVIAFGQVNGNSPEYYVFIENGRQGVKTDDGNVVIPALYDQVGWTDSGFKMHSGVTGYRINGKWGLVNATGKIIADPVYTTLEKEKSGTYIIAGESDISGRIYKGLINASGEKVLEFRYGALSVVNERVIARMPSGNNLSRAGLLAIDGKVLIPFEFRNISPLGSLRYSAETPEGKYLIFDDVGNRISNLVLDSLSSFIGDFSKIWEGHKAGLINRNGEVVVTPSYKQIEFGANSIEGRLFDRWQEIDDANNEIASYRYDRIRRVEDTILLVEANSRFWLITESDQRVGNVVLDSVEEFEDGLAVALSSGKWGVLKSSGEWLISPKFKSIDRRNGFFNTSDFRNRWRVYDEFAVEKTQGFYEEIGEYHKLHFPVRKGDYWGLISRTGEQVINCVFDSLSLIRENLISVKFKGLYGIIDIKGNWVILPNPHKKEVINDLLYLELKGRQSIIKRYDGDIVYFTDNPIEIFDDYFLERLSNGKVWKINYSGVIQTKELVDIIHREPINFSEFEDIFSPSEGFVGIRKDGKYGFVDDQNRLRIANRYDSIKSFHEGFAGIKLLGRWGFVDKSENLRIQPVYDWVDKFEGGICVVRQGEKYFLINQGGKALFTKGFDELYPSTPERYLVRRNSLYGLVAKSGEMMVNYIYDGLEDLGGDMVIVHKLGKFGVVGIEGLDVIPRIYDDLEFDPGKGHFFGLIKAPDETLLKLN